MSTGENGNAKTARTVVLDAQRATTMATNAKTPDAKIANNKTASATTMTTNTVPYETTARVRDTCLCLAAQRAARALARRFDHAFRPLGLTSGQFSLLMSLNRPAPASMGSIAELLEIGPHHLDRQCEDT